MGMNPRTLRPSSTFSPKSISGLALWLDASDSATLFQDAAATTPATAASDPVGAWLDKSGNGRHATQSTAANRPTISANTQGGKKMLGFDGANGRLTISFPVTAADPVSMIAVARRGATTWGGGGGGGYGSFLNSTGGSSGGPQLRVDTGNIEVIGGTNKSTTLGSNVGVGSCAIIEGMVSSVATSLYVQGALVDSDAGAGSITTTGTRTSIGAWNDGTQGGGPLNGDIAELICYRASLSTSQRQRLERYLAAKWGIVLAPQVSNADAQDWINRVYANGGTVTSATASAVNAFCDSITNASLRDRFYRLNLFCGSSLNAALVPLYRTWRVYSGRNLMSAGDSMTAATWTKSGVTVTASSSERPFAYGPYANVVTATAGTGVTPHVNGVGVGGFGTVTYSAYLKANGQNTVRILPVATAGQTFPGGGTVAYANIDLTTGAISNVLAGTSATATNVGNGWWRLAYTVTNNGTGQTSLRFDIGNGNAYNATGSESVLIWGVQSEVGSVATDFDPYPLGNTTDTNVGPFVSGDYAETGASGGLTPNGVGTKRLDTGLTQTALGVDSCHLSVYEIAKPNAGAAYRVRIGSRGASAAHEHLLTNAVAEPIVYGCGANSSSRATASSYAESGAFWLGSNTTATSSSLFKNGLSAGAGSPATRTAQNVPYFVFALNDNGSLGDAMITGRLGAYSIGLGMTSGQAAAYYTAMQAFQTALGRNV